MEIAGFWANAPATARQSFFTAPIHLQEDMRRKLFADFLNIQPFGPQREALIELLGVGDDAGAPQQESYTSSSQ